MRPRREEPLWRGTWCGTVEPTGQTHHGGRGGAEGERRRLGLFFLAVTSRPRVLPFTLYSSPELSTLQALLILTGQPQHRHYCYFSSSFPSRGLAPHQGAGMCPLPSWRLAEALAEINTTSQGLGLQGRAACSARPGLGSLPQTRGEGGKGERVKGVREREKERGSTRMPFDAGGRGAEPESAGLGSPGDTQESE